MERKLAAILSADVEGYSRLMGEDDEATIRTLTAYQAMMTALVEQHHGRVVDSPGDNLLAEFASAVNAVQGAVAIQKELKTRNAELPPNRQMQYRIGINLGDVVSEAGRLYGEGVNVAARLEALADAGGICISGKVFNEVKTKLQLSYASLGAQSVKNIAEPVPVYKVQMESDGTAPPISLESPAPSRAPERTRSRRWPLAALAIIMALAVGAGVLMNRYLSPYQPSPEPAEEPPALPLPDKPSIAVLPFTNMSGDPEQEYFSDGLTDTLITDLSKLSELFVIARHSVFTYKGQAINPSQVSRELGVRYVMEGSVQRAKNRVRINAQLIDATTGGHVWAERYDRELQGIFTLQDEITGKILLALQILLSSEEQARFQRAPTDNLEAYDTFLRALALARGATRKAHEQARQLLTQAIQQDPSYAAAYAQLGYLHWAAMATGWDPDPRHMDKAAEFSSKALALEDSLPWAYITLGQLALWRDKQHAQAVAAFDTAIHLDPNFASAHLEYGHVLTYAGKPEQAIESVKKAMRLDPHYPPVWGWFLARAYTLVGRYDEARPLLQRVVTLSPDFLPAYADLAVIAIRSGQLPEARAAAAAIKRINPDASLEGWRQSLPYKDPAVLDRVLVDLGKAGLE